MLDDGWILMDMDGYWNMDGDVFMDVDVDMDG